MQYVCIFTILCSPSQDALDKLFKSMKINCCEADIYCHNHQSTPTTTSWLHRSHLPTPRASSCHTWSPAETENLWKVARKQAARSNEETFKKPLSLQVVQTTTRTHWKIEHEYEKSTFIMKRVDMTWHSCRVLFNVMNHSYTVKHFSPPHHTQAMSDLAPPSGYPAVSNSPLPLNSLTLYPRTSRPTYLNICCKYTKNNCRFVLHEVYHPINTLSFADVSSGHP